jgi:peptidoglycan/xylan/chitin deacetylase (PgdA/CDA1 family)
VKTRSKRRRSVAGWTVVLGCLSLAVLVSAPAAVQLRPNELGRLMILEYHLIEEPEARWARTPANFRRDLERLRERGYRLIPLNDLLDGRINLPAGTTPLILTFDDSSPGQLRFLQKNGKVEVDPDCAVGILEAFSRQHPEFGRAATFYVLPGAKQPHRLFGQPEHEKAKLEYLVTRGFEIGNHTLWHANLSKYPEATVRTQLAHAQEWIEKLVPGYRPRTLALPMGAYPREVGWAIRGTVNGTRYQHDAILMVAGGAAPSPFSPRFDPYRLPRIQAVESELAFWLRYFQQRPDERFVSDGDPAVVTIPRARRAELRDMTGKRVRLLEEE